VPTFGSASIGEGEGRLVGLLLSCLLLGCASSGLFVSFDTSMTTPQKRRFLSNKVSRKAPFV